MSRRIVIVGGVAGGASAAAKARRTSEDVEIVLLEAGPYVSFANCGLPYHLGGEIEQRDELFVVDESRLRSWFRIDVRTRTEAVGIDRASRTVELRGPGGDVEKLPYDRLVLATGAVASRPPVEGLDRPNVFFLRTVPDVDGIMACLSALRNGPKRAPHRALVIGGGYIGLEAAEQLTRRGLQVTIVEMLPQLLAALDAEMAAPVKAAMEAAGCQVLLGEKVARVVECDGGAVAVTGSGRELPFDLAVVATGVRPNVRLAKGAGIVLGKTGAIRVDRYQRTSDPAVYAAGDNSETFHRVLGRAVNIALAGPANKAGRVAGANAALDLAGAADDDPRRLHMPDVLGTSIVRAGAIAAAATGITESQARAEGLTVAVTHLPGASSAGYYPGATRLLVKLVWEAPSGRLLGAQAVGEKGADKRIDVLATAIFAGMTVEDLEGLDLCYSPPFGSAKDAVNLAGYAAANARRGEAPAMSAKELLAALNSGWRGAVLDVRTDKEWQGGHLDGALHVPLGELRQRLAEVPADRPVAVHCAGGYRSYLAQRILLNAGRKDVCNVLGGMLLIGQTQAAAGGAPSGAAKNPERT